jgi:hypothetical protein
MAFLGVNNIFQQDNNEKQHFPIAIFPVNVFWQFINALIWWRKQNNPRADGAKRRARVLIPPGSVYTR